MALNSKIDIIVSVFNEEKVIETFNKELQRAISDLKTQARIIYVNDGSSDRTKMILDLLSTNIDNVSVIHFSRNFGHEAAMIAGIDNSDADAIICMDADMQHPPYVVGGMVQKWNEGNAIVLMKRTLNTNTTVVSKIMVPIYYKLINLISPVHLEPNVSDFFLMSKQVTNILKTDFRERARFLRGFIQMIGFKRTYIEYEADSRAGGESKYNFGKLFKHSVNSITTFSNMPLRFGLVFGVLISFFSLFVGIYSIIMFFLEKPLPGYTTLVVFMSLAFAIQFILIGIIGEYIGYMFDEIKKRPIYIIDEIKL